ncbi:peptidoglycan-binding domain-containing protein [Yoonia sediminilitoris]|uniref:Putative peptidoglycan binding protein n=1 Tax=Yoonia sediminilitoris TaxID=1286148 RepID=A0A2T6K8L3_9RHOB|nr:peptidoglycan-binding protein [Yoonia sediminilitoris]PUB11040.1 putative peptidoglycan binding protein [Yoonia sediminilitoris]RCW90959.1 putative peptidoglycan binding protein [Yoonia sediminilitoris]
MRQTIFATVLAMMAAPALAEDTALLLGIERYSDLGRVPGADNLANAEDALRSAGYAVESAINSDGADMLPMLNRFAADAATGDRLIAGVAGRFYTNGDQTWLLAADARRPSVFGMGDAVVSLDMLMAVMGQAPGQALLVVGVESGDDDQIGAVLREGLGDLDVPQGVTVVVTSPNAVDDVLERAARPGGDVMAYVRDTRRVSALGYQPRTLVLQPQEGTAPAPEVDATLRFWNDAQEANSADSYRDFVLNYPQSPYAAEARRRLDAIESDPIRQAELIEDSLNLNRSDRRAIQRNLTLLDYNTRGVDGIFGPGTRGAVRNWQQRNGFEQTSFLTREQISRIDAQAARRQAEIDAEAERARQEALRLDRAYWEETGARGDVAGYRAYLDRYPNGTFAEEAKSELDKLAPPERPTEQVQRPSAQDNAAAREAERQLNINPILGRLIETRLAQLGFEPGTVDGRIDRDTRGAIARYQTNRNLPATGYLNQPTLARLLADSLR